jgi:hypothetical protein
MSRPEAAYGTREAYREFLAETLAMARIQAELGAKFAEIGDDVGTAYAVRQLVAYTRAAVGTVGDLRKLKEEGADAGS